MVTTIHLIKGRSIQQRSDYIVELGGLPDLSNSELKAQIRKYYGGATFTNFAVEAITSTSAQLQLSAAQTSALRTGTYVWDLVATQGNSITRLVQGCAIVTPGVTDTEAGTDPPQTGDSSRDSQFSELLQAAINLSALRVVAVDSNLRLVYASSDQPAQANAVLGVLKQAITAGSQGRVLLEGPITDSSWSWQLARPIFLGLNGALTQTPPTSGFLLKVARPLSTTQIQVELEQPILL